MDNQSPKESKNTTNHLGRKLVVKKEVTGDQIFDILKNFVLNNAVRAGNSNVKSLLSRPGARFITQIEIVPNTKRLANIDAIVEVYEQLEG